MKRARGSLLDWLTQQWVRATGRRIEWKEHPWLEGIAGDIRGIGEEFFESYARQNAWAIERNARAGLIAPFPLRGLHPDVVRFYEQTSLYTLDAWSEWSGVFRRFGWLLSVLFSRRLQQLNMPLSPLDTSRGVQSEIVQLLDTNGIVRATGWLRRLESTGAVLYAGLYGTCVPAGGTGTCIKVIFPLPNGNATVILRPEIANGSLVLHSSGRPFGDPGFYFVVRKNEREGWVRYVPSMRETIRVYVDSQGELRTDHLLTIWRMRFLKLHYRMSRGR